jgi:hypothetical protein
MPWQLSFEKQGAGALIVFSGVVVAADIRAVNNEIYAEAHVHALRYQICDFTGAVRQDLTQADVHQFALHDYAASRKNPSQIVALVGTPELFGGWATVYTVYQNVWSGFRTETFPTVDAAREWISRVYPDL